MTTAIVKVPSCWFICLPDNRWINLAQITEANFSDTSHMVIISWTNGTQSAFCHESAIAINQALIEFQQMMEERGGQIFIP